MSSAAASVVEALRRHAELTPSRTALSFLSREGTTQSWSYAEVDEQASALARELDERGLTDEPVVIAAPPGMDYVRALIGCFYAGAIAVPALSPSAARTLDTEDRLGAILADAAPGAVLGDEEAVSHIRELLGGSTSRPALLRLDELRTDSGGWSPESPEPGDTAFLQYTSGSVSSPRGVVVTHDALADNLERIRVAFGQRQSSKSVIWLPPHHDMGLIGGILQPLYVGFPVVLMDPHSFLRDPLFWLETIAAERATTSGGPNFAYDYCVQRADPERVGRLDLSCWTVAFNGAEPVSAETLERFARTFAEVGFRRSAFRASYGLAESTLLVATSRGGGAKIARWFDRESLEAGKAKPARARTRGAAPLVGCGPPIGSTDLVVVDPETRTPREDGTVGELWLRGRSVARGYWRRRDDAVFDGRLADGRGPFLRTGDLGFLLDGELYPTGRLKELIILHGRNIHPHDLERVAAAGSRTLRAGRAAAFEAGRELVLVHEVRGRPSEERLAEAAREIVRNLAESHAVAPGAVVLVRGGSIPRTSSGKLRRLTCRTLYERGELEPLHVHRVPQDAAGATPGEPVATGDPILARVARALRLAPAAIAPDATLAELGLQSIAAVELAYALGELGLDVEPGELLRGATLADLRGLVRRSGGRPPSPPREPAAATKASPGQQALFYLCDSAPGQDLAYHLSAAFAVSGPFELERFRTALDVVAQRHDSLVRRWDPERREWVLRAGATPAVAVRDAAGLSTLALAREVRDERRKRIDVKTEEPLRVTVWRRSDDDHLVLFAAHHLALDLWSAQVVLGELVAAYGAGALRDGAAASYGDFVRWQEDAAARAATNGALDYWREALDGADLGVPIAPDTGDAPDPTFRGRTVSTVLDADAVRALDRLAARTGATQAAVLLEALGAALARFGHRDEVVVGVPVALRPSAAFARTCGYLVNTVPVRLRPAATGDRERAVAAAHGALRDAVEHAEVPLQEIARAAGVQQGTGSPLVQVLFTLQRSLDGDDGIAPLLDPAGGGEGRLGDATLRRVPLPDDAAQLPLALEAWPLADGSIRLVARYDTGVFRRATMRSFLAALEQLVRSAPGRPAPALPQSASHGPEEPVPPADVVGLAAERAAEEPAAPAVRDATSAVTYGELWKRVERLSAGLSARGVGPGDVVPLLLEPSVDLVAAIWAVLHAGAAFMPLDLDHPPARLRGMLDEVRPAFVVVASGTDALAQELGAPRVPIVELEAQPAGDPGPVAANLPAYVMYTSGSTGKPKGVVIPRDALANRLHWMAEQLGVSPGDRVLQKTAVSFDPCVWELLLPAICGAELVVAPRGTNREPEAIARLVEREGITLLHFTPSLLDRFVEGSARPGSLRHVVCSGETLVQATVNRFAERFPGVVLWNLYGPTEAAIDVTAWRCEAGDERLRVPIGLPVPETQVYVLDRALEPLPPGATGELYLGGVQLAQGYLAQPGVTAERFVPSPFAAGERLYRTGDLGRMRRDGAIEFLGRVDGQLKLRGVRIEPAEIEAALASHGDVLDVGVALDERARRLTAYLVLRDPERPPETTELRAHAAGRLPLAMVPDGFAAVPEVVRSGSGKLDRRSLEARAAPLGTGTRAPADAVEQALADVWAAVLKVPEVAADANFFLLGGDSLLAVEAVALARERGLELTVADVVRHQTPAGVARALDGAAPGAADERVEYRPWSLVGEDDRRRAEELHAAADAYPLTALQQGLVYHSETGGNYEVYVTSIGVPEPFEREAFARALRAMTERHELLRTSFDIRSFSEPMQIVHEQAQPVSEVNDLRGLSEDRQREVLDRWIDEERKRRFDWTVAPLARFTAHVLSDESFRLTLTEPFLDGWSVSLLLRGILDAYREARVGRALPERLEAAPFGEYVALERRTAASSEARSYWEDVLDGVEVGTVPRAEPGAVPREELVRRVDVPLGPDARERAHALAAAAGVPLKSVLLALHMRVALLLNGGRSTLTGLLAGGRPEHAAANATVGLFLNAIPLRVAAGGGTWVELARAAHAEELAAMSFRRFPLAEIQRLNHGVAPFETLFNFTHFRVYGDAALEASVFDGRAPDQTFLPLTTQAVLHPLTGILQLKLDLDPEVVTPEQTDLLVDVFADAAQHAFAEPEGRWVARLQNGVALPTVTPPDVSARGEHTPRPLAVDRFAEAAERDPSAVAVETASKTWTYEELDVASRRLATSLLELGVGPEERVGLLTSRRAELVAALLGCLRAGAAFVPLDPDYPEARLVHMVEDSGLRFILAERDLLDRTIAGAVNLDVGAECARKPADRPLPAIDPRQLAYVIYTSGSTGAPKGVEIAHDSLANFLDSLSGRIRLGAGDRLAAVTTMSFDISIFELLGPLTRGATVILAGAEAVADPHALAGLLRERRATIVQATPSLWRALVDARWAGGDIRCALSGGEALSAGLAQELLLRVDELWNLFGPTETTIWSLGERLERVGEHVPIGSPLAETGVYVLGGDLEPVLPGVAGELYLSGSGVARGYHGLPALTAERFLPDPFGPPGSRMYRVGDLVRRRGGLEFLGRVDQQVKVRGFRIELGEVERALLDDPGVAEAAVVARRDAVDSSALVAYVRPSGDAVDPNALRERLRRRLPPFMVPTLVVPLEELPRTPNGKVDRKELSARRPTVPRVPSRPPANEIEQALCDLASEVLGEPEVGPEDDFLALGGHSLAAMRLAARIRERLGGQVGPADVMQARTFAALALEIGAREAEPQTDEELLRHVLALPDEEVEAQLELLDRSGSAR